METEENQSYVWLRRGLIVMVILSATLMLTGIGLEEFGLNGLSIVNSGILALLLTPFLSVAIIAFHFMRAHEWLCGLASLVVLGLLLFSLIRAI